MENVSDCHFIKEKSKSNTGLTLVFLMTISVFPLLAAWVLKPKSYTDGRHRWVLWGVFSI